MSAKGGGISSVGMDSEVGIPKGGPAPPCMACMWGGMCGEGAMGREARPSSSPAWSHGSSCRMGADGAEAGKA